MSYSSEFLRHLALYNEGAKVYLEDEKDVYVQATISKNKINYEKETIRFIFTTTANKKHELLFSIKDTYNLNSSNLPLLSNPDPQTFTNDISNLLYLNDASVLDSIRHAYSQTKLNIYVGPILLSINPYEKLSTHSTRQIPNYIEKDNNNQTPHIYSFAKNVLNNLTTSKKSQFIYLLGESGSGKTFNSYCLINYFLSACKKTPLSQITNRPNIPGTKKLASLLVSANKVLESFSNSKTLYNTSSSRVAKGIEIFFGKDNSISGVKYNAFLFDRNRVVHQNTNERNYHIFYQLIASEYQAKDKGLFLEPGYKGFPYINQNGETINKMAEINFSKNFISTRKALETIGITSEEQLELFKLLSAILQIGRITPIQSTKNRATIADDDVGISNTSKLLSIDSNELVDCISKRHFSIGNDQIKVNVDLRIAENNKNNIAKFLYNSLFAFLINTINESLISTNEYINQNLEQPKVEILDFCGPDNTENNTFEQLLLNYTNEKIYSEYLESVFLDSQMSYIKDKVRNWEYINYKDNRGCIELIDGSTGIFSILAKELFSQNDEDFCITEKIESCISENSTENKELFALGIETPDQKKLDIKSFITKSTFKKSDFIIKHHFGNVTYNIKGFVERSRSSIPTCTIELLRSSKLKIVQKMLDIYTSNLVNNNDYKPVRNYAISLNETYDSKSLSIKSPNGKCDLETASINEFNQNKISQVNDYSDTIGAQLKKYIDDLIKQSELSDKNFICCINPNRKKEPRKFDSHVVISQIRLFDLVKAAKIYNRCSKIMIRKQDFTIRFNALLEKVVSFTETIEKKVEMILENSKLNKDANSYDIGNSNIYLSKNALEKLIQIKNKNLENMPVLTRKGINRDLALGKYSEIEKIIVKIQSYARVYLAKNELQRLLAIKLSKAESIHDVEDKNSLSSSNRNSFENNDLEISKNVQNSNETFSESYSDLVLKECGATEDDEIAPKKLKTKWKKVVFIAARVESKHAFTKVLEDYMAKKIQKIARNYLERIRNLKDTQKVFETMVNLGPDPLDSKTDPLDSIIDPLDSTSNRNSKGILESKDQKIEKKESSSSTLSETKFKRRSTEILKEMITDLAEKLAEQEKRNLELAEKCSKIENEKKEWEDKHKNPEKVYSDLKTVIEKAFLENRIKMLEEIGRMDLDIKVLSSEKDEVLEKMMDVQQFLAKARFDASETQRLLEDTHSSQESEIERLLSKLQKINNKVQDLEKELKKSKNRMSQIVERDIMDLTPESLYMNNSILSPYIKTQSKLFDFTEDYTPTRVPNGFEIYNKSYITSSEKDNSNNKSFEDFDNDNTMSIINSYNNPLTEIEADNNSYEIRIQKNKVKNQNTFASNCIDDVFDSNIALQNERNDFNTCEFPHLMFPNSFEKEEKRDHTRNWKNNRNDFRDTFYLDDDGNSFTFENDSKKEKQIGDFDSLEFSAHDLPLKPDSFMRSTQHESKEKSKIEQVLENEELLDEMLNELVEEFIVPKDFKQFESSRSEIFTPAHLFGTCIIQLFHYNLIHKIKRFVVCYTVTVQKKVTENESISDYFFWLTNTLELLSILDGVSSDYKTTDNHQLNHIVQQTHKQLNSVSQNTYNMIAHLIEKEFVGLCVLNKNEELGLEISNSSQSLSVSEEPKNIKDLESDNIISYLENLFKLFHTYFIDEPIIKHIYQSLLSIYGATQFNGIVSGLNSTNKSKTQDNVNTDLLKIQGWFTENGFECETKNIRALEQLSKLLTDIDNNDLNINEATKKYSALSRYQIKTIIERYSQDSVENDSIDCKEKQFEPEGSDIGFDQLYLDYESLMMWEVELVEREVAEIDSFIPNQFKLAHLRMIVDQESQL
ncbi:hypothetical protein BB559_000062 [Furculomyces boomerangus]|uniref:Myosin motor domain-containing protein n=2 Tax=Harpellales TaxID=61421 RepID=A0A2T9Z6J5_9FUNG|nr:hypothetical protein BB559_000062 [Furculomyces boomerangus]PVZ98961.1 hypothetical protein BB558_005037 [Smittium angustum]